MEQLVSTKGCSRRAPVVSSAAPIIFMPVVMLRENLDTFCASKFRCLVDWPTIKIVMINPIAVNNEHHEKRRERKAATPIIIPITKNSGLPSKRSMTIPEKGSPPDESKKSSQVMITRKGIKRAAMKLHIFRNKGSQPSSLCNQRVP